jgi:hypothetical protein
VLAGDVAGTTALVLSLDEHARGPLWPPIEALDGSDAFDFETQEGRRGWKAYSRAAQVVGQGCGTPDGVAHLAGWHTDVTEVVIRSRPRAWRDRWADLATRDPDGPQAPAAWRLVRRLVADGACAEPAHDAWVLGAIRGLLGRGEGWDPWGRTGEPLVEALRADQRFRDHGLWRLFEVPGTADAGLHRVGTGTDDPWASALVELAADGTIERDRLLDAALDALRRDFSPRQAGWFRGLHDLLAPTPDERAERQAVYHALCAAPDPAVVRVGTRALLVVAKHGRLDPAPGLEAARAALGASTKAPATEAVRIIAAVVRDEPSLLPAATEALADALLHPSRDVQERGVAVLHPHRAELAVGVRERLEGCADIVDPAVRGRIRELLGSPDAPSSSGNATSAGSAPRVPPARSVTPGSRPLRPEDGLHPVTDPGDLLGRLAVLLETGDDPDELELVLDGASRLAGHAPPADESAALVRRARTVLGGYQGAGDAGFARIDFSGTRSLVAAIVLAWLRADPPGPRVALQVERGYAPTDRPRPEVPLGERVRRVLGRIEAGDPRPLLGAPTHRGGWIAPSAAAERLAVPGVDDDRRERQLALLRLHPSAPDELRAALAQGIGGGGRPSRDPGAVAGMVLDSGHLGRRDAVEITDSADHPDSWLTLGIAARNAGDEGVTHVERWLVTVAPGDGEAVAAQGVARLIWGLWEVNHGAEDYVVPLLDDQAPIGPVAQLLVAAAACSDWPPARTAATDVLIQAIGDLRLDEDGIAFGLGRVADARMRQTITRWTPVLTEVAAEGPLHAHRVQRALEAFLGSRRFDGSRARAEGPREGGLTVRDAGGLVDLLRRLATDADARVTDPAARAFLETVPPRTKAGRAAREALAVSGTGAARPAAAVEVAAEHAAGYPS